MTIKEKQAWNKLEKMVVNPNQWMIDTSVFNDGENVWNFVDYDNTLKLQVTT